MCKFGKYFKWVIFTQKWRVYHKKIKTCLLLMIKNSFYTIFTFIFYKWNIIMAIAKGGKNMFFIGFFCLSFVFFCFLFACLSGFWEKNKQKGKLECKIDKCYYVLFPPLQAQWTLLCQPNLFQVVLSKWPTLQLEFMSRCHTNSIKKQAADRISHVCNRLLDDIIETVFNPGLLVPYKGSCGNRQFGK